MSKFYKYFKENMEALGLVPPPQSLFGTQQLAIGTISTILGCIDKFGTRVTMMEVIGAGSKLEQLAVVGAVGASYYAGGIDWQSSGCDRPDDRRWNVASRCSS